MKKLAIVLLINIYAVTTFGVGLKAFYCCGKLKSVTLTLTNEATDKCNKGSNKNDCCKTKLQFYKVKDTHFATGFFTCPVKPWTHLISFHKSFPLISSVLTPIVTINSPHAPPLYNGVPAYIFNCVYRV